MHQKKELLLFWYYTEILDSRRIYYMSLFFWEPLQLTKVVSNGHYIFHLRYRYKKSYDKIF